jgi:hypothetical protein
MRAAAKSDMIAHVKPSIKKNNRPYALRCLRRNLHSGIPLRRSPALLQPA